MVDPDPWYRSRRGVAVVVSGMSTLLEVAGSVELAHIGQGDLVVDAWPSGGLT